MLDFYENKGRKIFVTILIVFVVGFSIALIASEFISFKKDVSQMETVAEQANVPDVKVAKNITYNGQIEYVKGSVEKRSGKDTGWFSASKSDIVKTGDEVRTLSDSRAIITFEDGSAVRLDENTTIVFDGRNENIAITMNNGFVYNKVAKNDKRKYFVKTGDYIVTALGTEFGVENNGDDIDVMVVESIVSIKGVNGEEVFDNIEEGNKANIKGDEIVKTEIMQKDFDDEFIAWSTDEKGYKDEMKKSSFAKATADKEEKQADEKKYTEGSIILSGEKSSSGVRLHWDVSDVNTSNGFKVVKSKELNPVYPGNDYKYLSEVDIRDYKWKIDSGKKYHFRVCAYLGNGKCGMYSNDVYVDTPDGDDEDDKSDDGYASKVSLSASEDGDNVKLKWDISGGGAPKGFKVVKSKSKNPMYPGDDYKYLSDGDTRKYIWKDLKEDKTYYFRVCIYKGGKCGTYSNNVKVSL